MDPSIVTLNGCPSPQKTHQVNLGSKIQWKQILLIFKYSFQIKAKSQPQDKVHIIGDTKNQSFHI